MAALTAVTLATPVGNPTLWKNPESAAPGYVGGRARFNWQTAIGVQLTGVLEDVDPSGVKTIDRGKDALANYQLGPEIIITNNVPYIERLNNGHSTQAPAGFVEKAAQAAVNAIEGATILP